jgi:predicted AAA+ superfamily ATPase
MPESIERISSRHLPVPSTDPLHHPMIFFTGPRQVGKTFLTRQTNFPYFNWDTTETKKAFLRDPYFFRSNSKWIVFDEIHKRRDWKKLMKGYFDSPTRRENFVVTGSGRFNLAQRGGDSLQGRYDLFHVLPILYREFAGLPRAFKIQAPNFNQLEFAATAPDDEMLIEMGGFPEPLLRGKKTFLNKWQDLYIKRLIQEDVRDFSRVMELDKLELLARLLPERVKSPLSLKSLAEDIEVNRDSIKNWLRLFETLYLGFSVPPFHRKVHRAVKKERKWYFFQWTFCEDPGARFENYIATQLYSFCQLLRDAGLGTFELSYLRDQDRREIDFVITKSLKPVALIEVKTHESKWQTPIDYYARRFEIPSFILTQRGAIRRIADDKWIVPSAQFFDAIS